MSNAETQEQKIYQPHDKLFRKVLSNKQEVVKLLNKYFKFNVILAEKNIERYHCRFVNAQFENREVDVIYKIKNMNIFFLIEFQSTIDYRMAQRIAEYQIEIMKLENPKRENKKALVIPLVIPLVIYTNNKTKWKARKKVSEMQPKIKGYKNLEIGTYNILDINVMGMEELLHSELFTYKLLALEKAKERAEIEKIFEYILYTEEDNNNLEMLRKIAMYIHIGVYKNEKIRKQLIKKEEGEKMNFIKILEEDRDNIMEKGRQEGLKEGLKKSKIEIAKELLKSGIKPEDIEKYTKLSKQEIEKLEY